MTSHLSARKARLLRTAIAEARVDHERIRTAQHGSRAHRRLVDDLHKRLHISEERKFVKQLAGAIRRAYVQRTFDQLVKENDL